MNGYFAVAAVLAIGIGVAHSILGERLVLQRLFRRSDLPRLFGSAEGMKRTLRFAWHLTTIAWCGAGAVLLSLDAGAADRPVALILAATFLVSSAVAGLASRGRHLSWLVFLAIAGASWLGAGG